MLTQQENEFIQYWKSARVKRKKSVWKFSVGLPLGVMIVVGLFANLLSGWYTRADMLLRSNASLIVVILIASMAIVVFISVFSARHQWDQNEQRYHELLAKQNDSTNTSAHS